MPSRVPLRIWLRVPPGMCPCVRASPHIAPWAEALVPGCAPPCHRLSLSPGPGSTQCPCVLACAGLSVRCRGTMPAAPPDRSPS